MAVRKDTITLTFERSLQRRPLSGELCRWLSEEVGLSTAEMVSCEYEFGTTRIFVKLKSGEKISRIVEKNDGERRMKLEDGKSVKVLLSSNGFGLKIVRVKNLPTEVPDQELKCVLSVYGKVGAIEHERYGPKSYFAGLLTGVRVVKVALTKDNIPSYLTVGGQQAYVRYQGQKDTCQICASTEHLRAMCPKKVSRRNTYAGRLAGNNGPDTPVNNDDVTKFSFDGKRGGEGDWNREEEREMECEEQDSEKSSLEGDSVDAVDVADENAFVVSDVFKQTTTELEIPQVSSGQFATAPTDGSTGGGSANVSEVESSDRLELGGKSKPSDTADSSNRSPRSATPVTKKLRFMFDNAALSDGDGSTRHTSSLPSSPAPPAPSLPARTSLPTPPAVCRTESSQPLQQRSSSSSTSSDWRAPGPGLKLQPMTTIRQRVEKAIKYGHNTITLPSGGVKRSQEGEKKEEQTTSEAKKQDAAAEQEEQDNSKGSSSNNNNKKSGAKRNSKNKK